MNQIIFLNNNSNNFDNNNIVNVAPNKAYNKKKYIFTFIFIISNSLIFMIFLYFSFFNYSMNKNEKISKNLYDNFEIKTLYATNNDYTTSLDTNNYVIGIIEIDKIGISYPIISECTDENLKIAPCKFCGPNPNEVGNLCIVAHNYNNYKFFSKIDTLKKNDEIYIYDLHGNKNIYYVYDKFEVNYDDLECTNQNTNGNTELTLATCNNNNDTKRIIIKAKKE